MSNEQTPQATEEKAAVPAAKKEKFPKPQGKKSVWSVIIGVLQLSAVGLYGFLAVRAFMNFASEDAIDIVETFVDEIGFQDMVISENLLLFAGIACAMLALISLVSTVFLIIQKRPLKRAAMYLSIAAELVAVVAIALVIAFKANLFYLLFILPHVFWYGLVILYVAISTRDPLAAAKRKAEKEARKAAEKAEEEAEETEEVEETVAETQDAGSAQEPVALASKPAAAAVKTVVKKIVVEEEAEAEEVVIVKKKKTIKAKPKAKKKKAKIRFILYWIIATVHTALLGVVLLVGSIINAIASNSEDFDIMFQNFLRDFEVRDIVITKTQMMSVFILHAILSLSFIVTGIGLLRRSYRFAEFTKHFSLGLLIFMALSLLMQGFSSFTIMMGVYFAWFLFVTVYFRVAKLDGFLRKPQEDEDDEDEATLTDL